MNIYIYGRFPKNHILQYMAVGRAQVAAKYCQYVWEGFAPKPLKPEDLTKHLKKLFRKSSQILEILPGTAGYMCILICMYIHMYIYMNIYMYTKGL